MAPFPQKYSGEKAAGELLRTGHHPTAATQFGNLELYQYLSWQTATQILERMLNCKSEIQKPRQKERKSSRFGDDC